MKEHKVNEDDPRRTTPVPIQGVDPRRGTRNPTTAFRRDRGDAQSTNSSTAGSVIRAAALPRSTMEATRSGSWS